MKTLLKLLLVLSCATATLRAQIPQQFSYQGRITVAGVNFDGAGQFKFALVDAAGTTTLWSHDGTGSGGGAPAGNLSLPVVKGLYSVRLGASHPIPPTVFQNHADVRLRVWFNDGVHGTQQLVPDQPLASAPWALVAETANGVKDGSVTMAMLSPALQSQLSGLLSWQNASKPVIVGPTTFTVGEEAFFSVALTIQEVQSVALSGAPAGTTYDVPTQTLSGYGPSSGSVTFNLTATNGAGSTTGSITLNTAPAIHVDTVTGLDTNSGTSVSPVQTIAKGISLANNATPKRSVRVSKGTYVQAAALQLVSGIHVYGGYDRANDWTRNPSNTTTITCTAADGGHVYAVQAIDLPATTKLDGFTIIAGNATAAGSSSYGVATRGCANLVLSNNVITAGNGLAGSTGPAGADGYSYQQDGIHGDNGTLAQGGQGGGFYPHAGGDGGAGGFGFNPVVTASHAGFTESGATAGTSGIAGQPGGNGGAGGNGSNGSHGPGGAGGSGATLIAATLRFSASAGVGATNGLTGESGGGGGGGGGSKSGSTNLGGGGGGEGGGGGAPGDGGDGGLGGGASLPVAVFGGTVGVTGCSLITGTAGNGGSGGKGGDGDVGGTGGNGGFGSVLGPASGGDGGKGGNGGKGGSGGGGGGGAGGASVCIAAKAGSNVAQSGNTFTVNAGGAGGPGGLSGLGGTTPHQGKAGSAGYVQAVKLDF